MDWNKLPKYVFYTLLSIVIGYIVFLITVHVIFRPGLSMTKCEEYKTLFFKPELLKKIKPMCGASTGNEYTMNHYFLSNTHYIDIWEFENNDQIKINNLKIIESVDLSDIEFWSGATLNSKSNYQTTINYGFDFNDGMEIQLDEYAKIEHRIETPKYRGFYGVVNRISLSDGEGKPQILLDYLSTKEPILFLVYKTNKSVFVITVVSTNYSPFDYEYIINNLNLN